MFWLKKHGLGFVLAFARKIGKPFLLNLRAARKPQTAERATAESAPCRHPLARHPFYLRMRAEDFFTYGEIFVLREYDFAAPEPVTAVIDAGANIGLSSAFFASRYPRAKIIALEPEAENFALLQKNAAPYENIFAERAALWREETSLRILSPGGCTEFQVTEESGEGQTVAAVTVGEIMRRHNIARVSVLKVDIEGAEREVFADPSAWLERVDFVAVETHENIKPGCQKSVAAAMKNFKRTSHVKTMMGSAVSTFSR